MIKILAIDGGGIRGIIPTMILNEIEARTNRGVATLFDLIVGTSVGGIISLYLSMPDGSGKMPKNTAGQGLELLVNEKEEIFNKSFWRNISSAAGIIDERYSIESLEALLHKYLGDEILANAVTRVMVSSYDLENRRPFFFRSWQPKVQDILMRHAARATSAAPTYFTPARIPFGEESLTLVDGGVFVNNPAMCAYAEARSLFPDEEDFMIVSLGTGLMTNPIPYAEASDWGVAQWAVPILDVVFDGLNDAIDYQLNLLMPGHYYRFQRRLLTANDALDDTSDENIAALQTEARTILQESAATLNEICSLL